MFATSCSEESKEIDEIIEVDTIIGEWFFISEHSYFCSNDEISTPRPADDDIINTFSFKEDGTYIEIEDDMLSNSGLWEKNEDGTYKIIEKENVYEDVDTFDIKIEFEGNDILQWGVFGCDDDGSDTYVYARYDRIN